LHRELFDEHDLPHDNELLPNKSLEDEPLETNKALPRDPSDLEHSPTMKEEMDYLAHQRFLKDKSMRRKKQKEQPVMPKKPMQHKPVVPPVTPQKDRIDPITGEPLLDDEVFDMMTYMKKQRLAKEKEMLEKEREDPNYKPLSPTAHKPGAVPQKDQKKLDDAEKKQRK